MYAWLCMSVFFNTYSSTEEMIEGKKEGLEVGKECCEILSSGHIMPTEHMYSEENRSPASDLHGSKHQHEGG